MTEANGAGATTHQWANDPVSGLGGAFIDTAGATPTWLLGDYQGSITDTAGTGTALTGTATWDPFGIPIAAPTGAMSTNPLRFHNQYQDTKTNLYDVRLRDYDATQGRFTGPDPVAASPRDGFIQNYSYGYNNPLTFTDPSGACWVCGAVGAVGGAIIGGISGGYNAYKDSGGDWSETWEGAGKGAIQGGLSGGAAGLCAPGGIAAMAVCAGAGNAGGGFLNSLIWGDDYGWSDAGKDFAWGAGTTLALGGLGKAGGKIFEKTKAVQWLDKNIVPHLPAKLRGQYKCPPTEKPTAATPKVWTSSDKYVATAANSIERAMPNRVVDVNNQIKMSDGRLREVDIDLGDIIIQVKEGNARGLAGQMSKTASTTGRRVIGYAPDIPNGSWEAAARQGVRIARDLKELLAIIKEMG